MMEKFKLRTGVIGIGLMGNYHSQIYKRNSNLVGVSDINKKLGQELSSNLSVSFFENYLDLLEIVDAVSISVPTKFHYDIAAKAIEKGVSVLIEKPLAADPVQSANLVKYAKDRNVVLAVGHIERFNAVVRHFNNNLLHKDEIIKSISANRFSHYPTRIQDVGVVYDLTIHDIDLIRSFLGASPKEVQAFSSISNENGIEEQVNVYMNFSNSIVANCETSWHSAKKVRKIEISTNKNFWILDLLNNKIIQTKDNSPNIITHVEKSNSLEFEIRDFLSAIIEDKPPLVTGEDGYEAVKIAESILVSLKEKKAVKIQ